MQYKCSQCSLAVIVLPEQTPIKGCVCEAPIVAEMSATATASGGLKA